MARLSSENWLARKQWKRDAEQEMEKLDETEKLLVKTLEVCYVIGKGRKYVPIIFPPNIIEIIEWLSKRVKHYIFENESGTYIRGNDAIRKISRLNQIGDHMNATKFRKLAATTSEYTVYVI